MRGSDLNRGNVLIWEEEDKNHVVTLHVNLIDFGLVDWNMDEDEVADEGFIDYLVRNRIAVLFSFLLTKISVIHLYLGTRA